MFTFLFALLVFVAVLFTVKKTPEKLLNRDQTEEWKGWMQVLVDALHHGRHISFGPNHLNNKTLSRVFLFFFTDQSYLFYNKYTDKDTVQEIKKNPCYKITF